MINNNLMHVNSKNIGTMDSLSEYQKLYINNFTNENGIIVWYGEIKLVLVNKKEAKEYEM